MYYYTWNNLIPKGLFILRNFVDLIFGWSTMLSNDSWKIFQIWNFARNFFGFNKASMGGYMECKYEE